MLPERRPPKDKQLKVVFLYHKQAPNLRSISFNLLQLLSHYHVLKGNKHLYSGYMDGMRQEHYSKTDSRGPTLSECSVSRNPEDGLLAGQDSTRCGYWSL